MRLPFLRSKPEPEAARPAARRADKPRRTEPDTESDVGAARARARRRLVGALVLLVIGVIGFPVLFETQPRPLPLDIPIELPAGDGRAAPPAATPGPGRSPALALPADAGNEAPAIEAPAAAPVVAESASTSRPATVVVEPRMVPPPIVVAKPDPPKAATAKDVAVAPAPRATAATPRTAEAARAAALLSGATPASAAAVAAAAPRFVVQVGAFSDAATLRATRAKVEKLGLKTYTQSIEGDAGKRSTRVRLGPFATRQEADAAAAQIKRAGQPANVLTL